MLPSDIKVQVWYSDTEQSCVSLLMMENTVDWLHLYALSNVLDWAIISIYPSVDNVGVDCGLLKQVLLPFHGVNPTTEPVHIIWTNLTATQVVVGCSWKLNNFVTYVPRFPQSQPPCSSR